MRVAVLGGGIVGACAALELADRGLPVDLYERDPQLISRSSYWNEGKIHLGLVYAQDRSGRTARTMIEGALRFRPVVERWVRSAELDRAVSEPFFYAVHRQTITPVAAIENHFRHVAGLCQSVCREPGHRYISPLEGWTWRRVETAHAFSTENVVAAYLTEERSIDPFVVAAGLRAAVAASPNITVRTSTTVDRVEQGRGSRLTVLSTFDGFSQKDEYGAVINALWQNRSAIDAPFAASEHVPVLHRFKIGLHSRTSLTRGAAPTVTFLLGPFGDIVSFQGRMYLSWYPAGHVLTSREPVPPVREDELMKAGVDRVEADSLRALANLVSEESAAWLRNSEGHWDLGGGYITAWGTTGIDDPQSRLHERFEIGVHSSGTYHSIDTGKYTTGPSFAEVACDRIRVRRSVTGQVAG